MAHDRITYGLFTWDFVRVDGQPQIPQRKLKVIQNPGVWGKAFKVMRVEADPARVMLEAVAVNAADEEDWIASMMELSGSPVSLYTGTSIAFHNQIFHEVKHERSLSIAVGAWGNTSLGSDARLLTFSATVEYPFGS